MSSFFIDNEGGLWACGKNDCGQLGVGDFRDRKHFTKVLIDAKILSVASSCHQSHTVVLDSFGNLWSCGENTRGQLGLGDYANRNVFVKIDSNTVFNNVSCSDRKTVALDTEGNVWSCGLVYRNRSKTCILIKCDFPVKFTNVKCGKFFISFLDEEGYIWVQGHKMADWLGTVEVEEIIKIDSNKFVKFSCGANHMMALDADGSIWSIGSNSDGQLGLGDKVDRKKFIKIESSVAFTDISCGSNHSAVLDENGSIWTCGDNSFCKLGVSNGGVHQGNSSTIFNKLPKKNKFLSVACIADNTIGLNYNGFVEICGFNLYGQLGLGTNKIFVDKLYPTSLHASTLINKDSKIDLYSSTLMNKDKSSPPKIKASLF